jgi:CRP/FNR family transcriptional regulator, cyclic AMP receptor protein
MPARQRPMLPLLELDPELGRLLTPERRETAQGELRVEISRLPQGEWRLDSAGLSAAAHVGLLLLDGVVSREVVVADCVSTELLGAGDVLRPWALDDGDHLLRHAVRWNALTESRVAVLDRRFGARLGEWPEINAMLVERIAQRARRLAATQAISQLNRVERRLTALFWHLAERWGRVSGDGVVISLTLSHRMLGQLVGARRPTVSTALARLDEAGQVRRRSNGTWLLLGDPAALGGTAAMREMERRREAADDRPALADAPPTPESAALEATSLDELKTTLERLRADATSGVQALREASDETLVLLERMSELRAERRRLTEARAVARA